MAYSAFTPERGFGWNRKTWVQKETTFGTLVQPTTAGSFAALEVEITPAQERISRDDTTGIRSFQNNRFSGRKSADWRVLKYLVPSGTVTTASDDNDFFECAFGDVTTLTNTIQYTPDDDDLPSLSLWKHIGHFCQGASGCAVNQMVLNFSGTDFSTVEFSGPGKSFVQAGTTTISAAMGGDATKGTIVVADHDFYATGVLIQIGGSANNGSGFEIVSVSSNGTIHFTPDSTSATIATGGTVQPYAPTVTTVGNALHGITGSFTTNSTAITIMSASVTLNNNLQLRDDEYGQSTPSAIILDRRREVTLNMEMYLTRTYFYLFGEARRFLAQDIQMVAGNTAGAYVQADMAQGELDVPALTDPGAEGEATLSATGMALSTSAGANDLLLYYY